MRVPLIFGVFKPIGATAYQPVRVVFIGSETMEPSCDKSTAAAAAAELDVEVINSVTV